MSKPNLLRRLRGEAGTLTALAVAAFTLVALSAPAAAQFFDFFGRPPPRPPQGVQGSPSQRGYLPPQFQQMFPGGAPVQQQRAADYSHAPPPEKRDTTPERNVLVLGDSMADWLAYGLEDAFAEQEPDLGVIRRHKTVSGLIRYQPKGDPADWAAAAKGILASERPDAIVVMLGLNDRVPIREPVEATKPGADKKDARGKDGRPSTDGAEVKPRDGKAADPDAVDDADSDTPSIMAPEKAARSSSGTYDFREDRWVELYGKKIEEMIGVLKSKGVPVIWVGLPAVRGPKATSDMLFLDALYRDEAGKAGITYVDVWDGFVDEAGRFMPQGPDFEGQIRRLRSGDGVFFTKAGARKLAHYVEREVTRLLANRSAPLALPNEPAVPEVNARPGGPAPRPLAGPVVPLVASSVGTDELLGGPGTRPAAVDALAARTLVKGEALAAPAGRADDYAWPRRDVERFDPSREAVPVATAPAGKTEAPVAAVAPDAATPGAPAAPAAPKKKRAQQPPTQQQPGPQQATPPQGAPSTGLFGGEIRPAAPPAAAPVKPRPR
ncbi:MAG: DUF459 domain-containing protein, partial [Xanthobacteraceae bacterium]|nr:DUF459 domain-containing protein [Xanthobacteraceae bacterium]